jgi:hypothetical protein
VDWDVDVGGRKVWGISDNANPEAKSHYLKGEIYPIRVAPGVKIGVEGKVSDWEGRTPGRSYYDGQRWQVGPAVRVKGESQDVDAAVYYGRQKKSSISHKGVEDKSSAELVGAGFGASFYGREDDGERWFSRTEVSAEALVPFNRENDDTASIVNLGVREYIYDPENLPVRTYGDARLSLEHPADPKAGVYLGAEDKWGLVSVNVGPRFNLGNGASYGTVGANFDAGKAIKMSVRAHRKGQIEEIEETSSALGME